MHNLTVLSKLIIIGVDYIYRTHLLHLWIRLVCVSRIADAPLAGLFATLFGILTTTSSILPEYEIEQFLVDENDE